MPKPLILTMGDPSGVGPEITVAAWRRTSTPLVVVADAQVMQPLADAAGITMAVIDDPTEWRPDTLCVIDHPLPSPAVPGAPDLAHAATTIDCIQTGVALVQSGAGAALVTNPINKKILVDGAQFAYPGHTEFLAALAGVPRSVMMLLGPDLRVVPVTVHVAIKDVPGLLTSELLEETIRITAAALRRDFGIATPRLAIAGLNPHAGEGGLMGREELDVITPLVARLAEEKDFTLHGPMSADTMFHVQARRNYDAAICMYHDQALIPLKTLAFADGVNATLGLPFFRTSPDHGTAYDIAGTGRADASSLLAAIDIAASMAAHRGSPA